MKKVLQTISRPIRMFWFREFELAGKKFYYGTIASALLILGVTAFAVHWFGILGLIVAVLKQGVRLLLAAIAKLTVKALVALGVKRAVIDFIVMPTMKRHVFAHIIPATIARLKDSRSRIIRWIGMTFAGLFAAGVAVFAFLSNGWTLIQTILTFIGGKLAASFGFKTIWTLIAAGWGIIMKYWVLIKTTPFGMLIQVYILSWMMDLVGKIIPDRAKQRLRPVKDWFLEQFIKLERFIDRLFGWHLEERMKKIARWIEPPAERKKRHKERLLLALERKKQQKQHHPQNDGAQIRGFDARRARRHRPERNRLQRWYARWATWENGLSLRGEPFFYEFLSKAVIYAIPIASAASSGLGISESQKIIWIARWSCSFFAWPLEVIAFFTWSGVYS